MNQSIIADARVTTILEGLKSSNEMKQQDAAMELADLLLMGNEDSLPPNLPIRVSRNDLVSTLFHPLFIPS